MSVTIVAIPEKGEDVWKVSTQKVPHMTMLFLGDLQNIGEISLIRDHVEHIASTMHRFWMSVDRRGTLGPDQADVLFFDKYNVDWLEQVRHYLLSNNHVKTAYDSIPQFDQWVPHLTVGYPDTPANDDAIEGRLYGVRFDRLALWVTDFEGVEFVLPNETDDMVMRDSVEQVLAHYGVKGMKWGVRKRSSRGKPATTKFQKPATRLSDAELNRRIKRIETEKRYNSLNEGDKARGRQVTGEVLSSTGKRLAKSVALAAGTVAVKQVLSRTGSTFAKAVSERL